MAAQDASALERAKRYYDFVLKMYRDPESDPYRIAPKCIASTRSMKALARPMILLNVASVMRGADPERTELYGRRCRRADRRYQMLFISPGNMLFWKTSRRITAI